MPALWRFSQQRLPIGRAVAVLPAAPLAVGPRFA